MFENVVLFRFCGEPWTLAAALLVHAAILFVVWLVLLPNFARKYGAIRVMSEEEAATRALGHVDPGEVAQSPLLSGPAVGKKWGVSFSIGTLRDLWRRGERRQFYALPMFYALFPLAVVLAGVSGTLLTQSWVFLTFSGFGLLLIAIVVFMMWAAVHTDLE